MSTPTDVKDPIGEEDPVDVVEDGGDDPCAVQDRRWPKIVRACYDTSVSGRRFGGHVANLANLLQCPGGTPKIRQTIAA